MNADRQDDGPTLSPTLAERVDAACDRFEAAWKAGTRPRIEDYLDNTTELDRPALLTELLALELAYRLRATEFPAAEEYRARFPEHAGLIETVFGRVAHAAAEPTRTVAESAPTRGPDRDRATTF